MRFVRPSDEGFLLDLFMAARPWLTECELEPEAIRALCEQQLRITRTGTGTSYPEHLDFIVERTGQSVAHLVVHLGVHDWRISQLEVHSQARGKGIGADLVRSLQAAAAKLRLPITASTPMTEMRAIKFWSTMGFMVMGNHPPLLHLAWVPPGQGGTGT